MTKHQSPPLELISYEVVKFSYKTNLKYNIKSKRGELESTIISSISVEDPFVQRVDLEIKTLPRGMYQYKFAMHISGVFKVSGDITDENERNAIVARNGASILYSTAREYIFMATCHGIHGSMFLPTVSFLNLQPEKIAN